MPTHQITTAWTRTGDSITVSASTTADGEHNFDIPLTASQANKQVDVALDVSEVKSLLISSDVDCVVKTNSSGSPADTLTITGGIPLVWYVGCGLASPLGTDVTALFITNSEAVAGTVKIRVLEDVTP